MQRVLSDESSSVTLPGTHPLEMVSFPQQQTVKMEETKSWWESSSRWSGGWAARPSLGCGVSHGCDSSQQLLLTPLHCRRSGCVTHTPYHERSSTYPGSPRSAHALPPSLRAHTLIPSHPGSAEAPAAGTPRLPARSPSPASRGCGLTLTHSRLRPIVWSLSVGPV